MPKAEAPKEHRRGRKPGSRNKKTLEREKAEAEAIARGERPEKTEPPKRGRKKGTKDLRPRKKRSDAGKPRGPRKKKAENTEEP